MYIYIYTKSPYPIGSVSLENSNTEFNNRLDLAEQRIGSWLEEDI